MFNLSFQSTFLAAFQILLMAGGGYLLMKRTIIDERGLLLLSRLVIDLFLPRLIFNSKAGLHSLGARRDDPDFSVDLRTSNGITLVMLYGRIF